MSSKSCESGTNRKNEIKRKNKRIRIYITENTKRKERVRSKGSFGVVVRELGFWYVKKMDLTIASLLDVVDRLGWIGGRTDLLTYPEYVIFKGIDTIIDEKRIRLGLKLNVYALPFNPKALIQKN